jgi:hypothetical protein
MLTRAEEEQIKTSLTKTIAKWLEDDSSGDGGAWPYVGHDIAEIMAAAAFQVLRGVDDA